MIIPGTHDVYDRASIYRAYDLKSMAGSAADDDLVTVLTPDAPTLAVPALKTAIHGGVFATKRAPESPLKGLDVAADPPDTRWHLGMIHGSIAIPGKTDRDEVVITTDEIAASGLDYLALGHWHAVQEGRAGNVAYAYSGAPEPVAMDQDRAGKVLLVEIDEVAGKKTVKIDQRQVGRTRFERVQVDAATIVSQPVLVATLAKRGDPDLVLHVRLVGVRPDELDLDIDEVEGALSATFLKVRVRDTSMPALTDGVLPSPDTVVGAFIRRLETQITELEASERQDEAAELRDALRLGRLLLAGHEVSL